jgi:hypothetical protein
MGRKNRMKSTFANQVSAGSFWIRHKGYGVLINQNWVELLKDDVVIVLGFLKPGTNVNMLDGVKIVKCYSQKMNCIYTTTLEQFYFNYHKL